MEKLENLIGKMNKYSAKYDTLNKLLKHRQQNLLRDIAIGIAVVRNGETNDYYNTIGRSICIKNKL